MLLTYKTVRGSGEMEIIIEKSRFIAYVSPCKSEEEALQFIEGIRKKHWDATHNCVAYLIGEQDQLQKANDDGEPSGTAGKPMLEVLKKMGVKDTAVVVTRYFGGIKLGAGGLIRAYGQATKEGILATGVIERILHKKVIVDIDYTWHGKIVNEMNQVQITIEDTQFTDRVTMTLLARLGEEDKLIEQLTSLTNGQAEIALGEELYIDVPYTYDYE